MKRSILASEKGFTLIELLYSVSIVGILAAISMTAFYVYKEDVEYAKAVNDLRNARTAFEVGDSEASAGDAMGLTFTATTGGEVVAPLDEYLPGAVTSNQVMLGAQYRNCSPDEGMVINQMLVSIPCNAERYTSYTRFCNGLEILQNDIEGGGC